MTIQEEQQAKREWVISELKRLRPDAEFVVGKWVTDLVYYTVAVVKGEIKVERNTRGIYIKDDPEKLARNRYLTQAEAKNAIEAVLPEARAKFEQCLTEYRALTSKLGFSIGYNVDGDTHGIYNEYEYISFKIGEFSFTFEIEN